MKMVVRARRRFRVHLRQLQGTQVTVFEEPKEGEWVQPIRRGYLLACCDCGLVHRLNFKLVKYAGGRRRKVRFQAFRENGETKQLRKRTGVRLRTVDK